MFLQKTSYINPVSPDRSVSLVLRFTKLTRVHSVVTEITNRSRKNHQNISEMIQRDSDIIFYSGDYCVWLNLTDDYDEIRSILHRYHQLLVILSLGLQKYGEKYISEIVPEDKEFTTFAIELINNAKRIMTFINEEAKVCRR